MSKKRDHRYVSNCAKPYCIGDETLDVTTGVITVPIVCVFCNTEFQAIRKSFKGTGKKCPECGAYYDSATMIATPLYKWLYPINL